MFLYKIVSGLNVFTSNGGCQFHLGTCTSVVDIYLETCTSCAHTEITFILPFHRKSKKLHPDSNLHIPKHGTSMGDQFNQLRNEQSTNLR